MAIITTDENHYWELIINCPNSIIELVQNSLFEASASGIEELSRTEEITMIKVFFSSDLEDPYRNIHPILEQYNEKERAAIIISALKKPIENWQENWKEHFKPIEIGHNFLIRPPWTNSKSVKKDIVIEPGFGFGTGYHESTSLALEALEQEMNRKRHEKVIDVGAGSGILTIAALLMGAKHTSAFEIDLESLQEIHKNIVHSGLNPDHCTLYHQSPEQAQINGDLILANIIAEVLLKLKESLIRLVSPGGILILSGIIDEYKDEVLLSFQEKLTLLCSHRNKEWHCFSFQKAL